MDVSAFIRRTQDATKSPAQQKRSYAAWLNGLKNVSAYILKTLSKKKKKKKNTLSYIIPQLRPKVKNKKFYENVFILLTKNQIYGIIYM